ncbi:MAG: type 2 isopentenyl-diphosphate Delta-isomerase [Thaumarchaeota archaeon]|nr:type 2 isopentenyl-diphosphate Delta-isomerase [Candidatus Calditenuaceae archaeon]MDW8041959.1 type 2 isopentenyl-diphosphate Delta-isomerase [Nitrososphaerota archaeon]
MSEELSKRKSDHIRIASRGDIEFHKTNWLEHVELVHRAIPELSLDEIETRCYFLGRAFSMPVLIEGMTGGTEEAMRINRALAVAAQSIDVPLGVGSQRAGIVDPSVRKSFTVVREVAPDVFLIANVGAAQLVREGPSFAVKAVEMLDADALAVHVNVLQELVQPGGDASFSGVLKSLQVTVKEVGVPVIVKEVGCGLSYEDVVRLREVGVAAVDVAGAGGTNWTEIERRRAMESGRLEKVEVAELYREWGIPTAASVLESSCVSGVEVVGSGGIRNGLEVAKVVALGAETAGIARPFLLAALEGPESVTKFARRVQEELKVAMMLTGSKTIGDLSNAPYVLHGPLLEWYTQRVAPRLRSAR